MPVTLDQILTATRGRLPDLRARRAAVEREAAAAVRPPSLAAALKRRTRRRHRGGEAPLAVGGLDPRGSRSGRARRALRAPRRRGDLGAHRRAVLRRLARRPPGGRRPHRRPGAPEGLHSRRAPDRGGAGGGRRRGAADRPGAQRLPTRRRCSPARAMPASRRWSRYTRRTSWRARSTPAPTVLGVNSRDLDTFRVDTDVRLDHAPRGTGGAAWPSRRAA